MNGLYDLITKDFKDLDSYKLEEIHSHIMYHLNILQNQHSREILETEAYFNWKEYFFEPIVEELISKKMIPKRDDRFDEKRIYNIYNEYLEVSNIYFSSTDDISDGIKKIKKSCSLYCKRERGGFSDKVFNRNKRK